MTQDNEHAVPVLGGLVRAVFDSAEGYEKAAQLARNPRFKSLFLERAQARRRLTQELREEARTLGEQPPEEGSMLGQAHLWFTQLRDRISGQSDKALIEEVERGEGFVRDRFANAARDEILPPPVRALVERAAAEIASDHDETRAIKNEFH